MRLLHYDNNGDLSLTEFFESAIPKYAILSHRWEAEEVTIKDLLEGTSKSKAGYGKIQFCGEQARCDGLQYFWVDTCCIDKANSTELSEAINSMFRWYQEAARCYVYLSDVSTRKRKADDIFTNDTWESAFRDSEWFTRGWTLQELLAPRSVEFFSRNGKRIGDKKTLKYHIQEITGIPISALEGAPLSQFEVEERFSWATNRRTTRAEDKAYSLLGMFGIHLPLIYGEGREHAFRRLKKEIQNSLTENEQRLLDPQSQSCIQDLRTTDPREDKKRIEDTKGGLLRDSYQWILEHPDFQQWRDDKQSRLLWIKGDPGKGKTMLICGILDEISPLTKPRDTDAATLLSYFFCQATDSRINNAVAVLRGLIYLLIDQQPSLVSHVRKKYDHAGKALFEDANAWVALSEIFTSILQDSSLKSTYLIVDALDECEKGLPQLLNLVIRTASMSPHIKWIVTSRNDPNIEAQLRLDNTQSRLSLELNEKQVSHAIEMFINFKVSKLPLIMDDSALQEIARGQIYAKASGTFLWAALVLKELEVVESWDVLDVLQEMPLELEPLYDRMLQQVQHLQRKDPELCRLVLSTMTLAYRPLHLLEVGALSDLPEQIATNLDKVIKIVNKCGSFLTIRENRTYFIHQSAKDFLLRKALDRVFPSGKAEANYTMLSRSCEVMSRTLQRDIYRLHTPEFSIDKVEPPFPDPLDTVKYSCLYWIDHLLDCDREVTTNVLKDRGSVHQFLCMNYIYWLEALSLMKSLPDGIIMIMKLENWLQANESPDLFAFIHDARRFAVYNRSVIEQAPLQLYCSALIFAPEKSIIRKTFEKCIPPWIERKPRVEANWSAALQTLEGHTHRVNTVTFSLDSKQIVSGSDDSTVRLWDATTGAMLQTLKGHTHQIKSVVFSSDRKQVISGSDDSRVLFWDAATGAVLQRLKGHSHGVLVKTVAFSPDGRQVASSSNNSRVQLWDIATGATLQTFIGHTYWVDTVAFSPDGKQIVSGSFDGTVRLWDTVTGAALHILLGHIDSVKTVAFSSDGKQVVSGSTDCRVRLWDTSTGAALQILKGHTHQVNTVAFSPDGKQVVSGSDDTRIQLWDTATGAVLQTIEGHNHRVNTVAFSPDGKQLVSGSDDSRVRLWDVATQAAPQKLNSHTHKVNVVAFSPDGKQVVSGSDDSRVLLWDAATGVVLHILKGHSRPITTVGFSSDNKQVISGSEDSRVRLWDAATGAELQIFKGHTDWVNKIAFSPDSKQVASGSDDGVVMLWDSATGKPLQILESHSNSISSVAFSSDSKQVVSGFSDGVIRLWDVATGKPLQMIEGRPSSIRSISFSPDSKQIVSGSSNGTVQLWDAGTGKLLQILEGYSGLDSSVAFSPDGKLLPGLLVSEGWVVEGDTKLLWLSPDHRLPSCAAVRNKNLVLGYSSGRVSIFGFKEGTKFVL